MSKDREWECESVWALEGQLGWDYEADSLQNALPLCWAIFYTIYKLHILLGVSWRGWPNSRGQKTAPQKLSIMNGSPLGLYPPSLSAVIVPSLSALHVLPNILFWNDSASPCGLVFVSCWFKGVFLVWFKKFGSTVRMIIPAFVCVSRRHNKTSNNKFDWNMHEQAAESAT